MPTRFTRRRFLQTTVAAGALGLHGATLRADEKKLPPSERLNVAVVGVHNRGRANLDGVAAAGVNVVALCDVDEKLSAKARQDFPKAAFHTDFRRMLDQKGIDAVVVSTPDHNHAVITAAALKAGKHVYCEKPLTHTVREARVIAELTAKHKRVTQMGTQIHAGNNYRRVVELVQTGAIGPVREVHVWCGKSWGGQDRPKGSEPVPDHLDWDQWLGPAPKRPFYHGPNKEGRGVYHPYNWRGWWDFGGGTLADMACHHTDLPFWALKLHAPTSVRAEGPPVHKESTAVWIIVHYEYPSRGDLPPVKLTWYDGGKRPPHFAQGKLPKWGDGTLFVGAKGMLLAGYNKHVLLPQKQFKDFDPPKPFIPESIGHHKEWVEACKTGGETTCHFGYSGPLTEAVLLGNVAYRCGKAFTWDSDKLKTNEPAANELLHKEYRKGWSL